MATESAITIDGSHPYSTGEDECLVHNGSLSNHNKEGERVCDLYGGVGLFTLPISKILGENGEVHLIEVNSVCIADATEMFADIKNIFIHHGTVEQKLGSMI